MHYVSLASACKTYRRTDTVCIMFLDETDNFQNDRNKLDWPISEYRFSFSRFRWKNLFNRTSLRLILSPDVSRWTSLTCSLELLTVALNPSINLSIWQSITNTMLVGQVVKFTGLRNGVFDVGSCRWKQLIAAKIYFNHQALQHELLYCRLLNVFLHPWIAA